MTSAELIQHLDTASAVDEPVTVVADHPDDETLGLGARFWHLRGLCRIPIRALPRTS